MFNIEISSHTDIGDVKQTNQDCIFSKSDIIGNHSVGLFIVADGCGGLSYGEEISNLVITHFSRVWNHELKALLQHHIIKAHDVDELLEKAIRDINAGALAFSHQVDSKVGSTVSLLLTIDNRFYIKNVGDSRIYLLRDKNITQLTEDQSLIADMTRNGEITKEEAKNFKKKNVLTMCIGVFDVIRTYSKNGKIKSGDKFLLCCDGVHNHISPEKMIEIVKNKKSPFEGKAEELRNLIEPGMANDNVSTVICRFKKIPLKTKQIFGRILLTLLLLMLFFSGVVTALMRFTDWEQSMFLRYIARIGEWILDINHLFPLSMIAISGSSFISLLIMAFQGFGTKKRTFTALLFAVISFVSAFVFRGIMR